MATQTYDDTLFRQQFQAFASTAKYPEANVSAKFDMATMYVSNVDYWALSGARLLLALNLLTAHLMQLEQEVIAGNTGAGITTSATVDKVTVALQAPPVKTGWQHWLAQTAYGLQLWSLLSIASAGGFYVGGALERQGFRKGGGGF